MSTTKDVHGQTISGNPPRLYSSVYAVDLGNTYPERRTNQTIRIENRGGPFSGHISISTTNDQDDGSFNAYFVDESLDFPMDVSIEFFATIRTLAALGQHTGELIILAGNERISVPLYVYVQPYERKEPKTEAYVYATPTSREDYSLSAYALGCLLGIVIILLMPILLPLCLLYSFIELLYKFSKWLFGKEWPSELASNVSYAFTRLLWRYRRSKSKHV